MGWLEKENKHLQSKISDMLKQSNIDKKLIEDLTSLSAEVKDDEVHENGDVDLKSATIENISEKFRQKEAQFEIRIIEVEKERDALNA